MKNKFNITGYFYKIDDLKCRKHLNIRVKNTKKLIPDLMVIMMNPGGSKPLNEIDEGRNEVETFPDQTQTQIMRVMVNCGLEYSRILNLSDVRLPESKNFYKLLPSLEKNYIRHSIFHKERDQDFQNLFIKNVPIIFGWGVAKELTNLAKIAFDKIAAENPIGIQKKDSDVAFYHPLPRNYSDQVKWVERVSEQLKDLLIN